MINSLLFHIVLCWQFFAVLEYVIQEKSCETSWDDKMTEKLDFQFRVSF